MCSFDARYVLFCVVNDDKSVLYFMYVVAYFP